MRVLADGPAPPESPQRAGPRSLITDISTVAHLLEQLLDHALNGDGLTARQYRALRHIWTTPGISRMELAKALYITPQAVGGLTQRLYGAGLIERDGGDSGLLVSFTVTELGADVLSRTMPIVAASQSEVMARLPTGTLDNLSVSIRELLTEIEPQAS